MVNNPYNPYDLQSKLLKGDYIGDSIGSIIGVSKEDTRSLDYNTYSNPNYPSH